MTAARDSAVPSRGTADATGRCGIFTLGYERRSADEVRELLIANGVSILVDVRLTCRSRRAGLSKTALSATLATAGIGYEHRSALGNPRDNRDGIRAGDPASSDAFRRRLATGDSQAAIRELLAWSRQRRVALFCYERDAATCHRRFICEALLHINPGLLMTHLP